MSKGYWARCIEPGVLSNLFTKDKIYYLKHGFYSDMTGEQNYTIKADDGISYYINNAKSFQRLTDEEQEFFRMIYE